MRHKISTTATKFDQNPTHSNRDIGFDSATGSQAKFGGATITKSVTIK